MTISDATLAPKHAIEVEGQPVDVNIARYVRNVEYESADGMADVGRITLDNPGDIISNSKMFQPGNEVSIYMGYGAEVSLTHIGRIVVVRNVPFYPEDGISTFQVVGYSKDVKMMDNSPEESKKRVYPDSVYSEIVERIAVDGYGMEADIDPTPDAPKNLPHKAGVSDYEMIQGLANYTGSVFWVDADAAGVWTCHFKDPRNITQDKVYTLKYNDGDLSTLLSFRPELLIKDVRTKIAVVSRDRATGRVIKTEVEEENDASPDVAAAGDPTGDVDGEYTTASDIKLFFGDFSFDIITSKRFTTEADVIAWAQQWFRRQRENFVMASGRIIGIESIMARQKHMIEGISPAFVGEYYFSKVKHIMNDTVGYVCDWNGRKSVP